MRRFLVSWGEEEIDEVGEVGTCKEPRSFRLIGLRGSSGASSDIWSSPPSSMIGGGVDRVPRRGLCTCEERERVILCLHGMEHSITWQSHDPGVT